MMIAELYRKQEKPFDSLAHTFFSIVLYCRTLFIVPFLSIFKNRLQLIDASS